MRDDKIWDLYTEGSQRMKKEFDIFHLVKTVRNIDIFVKSTLMDEKTRFAVKNSGYNVIHLDSDDTPSENESYFSEGNNFKKQEKHLSVDNLNIAL